MKNKISFQILLAAACLAQSWVWPGLLRAGRSVPQPVPTLVYEGVAYTAPPFNGPQKNGQFIGACDARTNRPLWKVRVYKTAYMDTMAPDIQDIFITTLRVQDGILVVGTETGQEFQVNLRTRQVSPAGTVLSRWAKIPNQAKGIQPAPASPLPASSPGPPPPSPLLALGLALGVMLCAGLAVLYLKLRTRARRKARR